MKERYHHLDTIRGITLLSMMLYHAVWDIVYIHDVEWNWFYGNLAYLWQQSICWTFILLSGFCWSFSRNKLRRGIVTFLAGVIISAVTFIFMPENRILFGILTFLGSAMLFMIILEPLCKKMNPVAGILVSVVLFVLFRNVNDGNLGFEGLELIELPRSLYANLFTTYLGFQPSDFFSTDYFSILPWFFLYLAGFFLFRLVEQRDKVKVFSGEKTPVLGFMGRKSLFVYMIHQPIIYGVLYVYFQLM